jgi:hypothetical protein
LYASINRKLAATTKRWQGGRCPPGGQLNDPVLPRLLFELKVRVQKSAWFYWSPAKTTRQQPIKQQSAAGFHHAPCFLLENSA